MIINTPYGNAEVPDNYANEYKDKTDIELIEILLEQNKRFLDPVLVQICVNRNLLKKGEAVEDLEMKLDWLKVQEYSKLKVENEKLKEELKENNKTIWDENEQAVLCGDGYCTSNFVREKIAKIKQLEQQLKAEEFDVKTRVLVNLKKCIEEKRITSINELLLILDTI